MSTIKFVVRNSTDDIRRGTVDPSGGAQSISNVGGSDVSLNLRQDQIQSYARQGEALVITLTDGEVIVLDGYFLPGGAATSTLFVSAQGDLEAVTLVEGTNGQYYANYEGVAEFGKWSPDDALFFVGDSFLQVAEAAVPQDDDVGMLAAGFPIIGGLWPLGLAAGGVGAAVLGDSFTDDDGDDDGGVGDGPSVVIREGTKGTGHVVGGTDQADGVDISGTGDVGAEIEVTVGDHTQTTTVDENGDWTVTFPPEQVPTGEYETPVTVVITDGDGQSASVDDAVVVDTVAHVTFDASTVEGDGTVNAVEKSDGVVLTGTVEADSTVTVEIDGTTYDANVSGTDWTLTLGAEDVTGGSYDMVVTVTGTDQWGNTATVTDTVIIDTETTVTINSATIGGDGTVNASEQAAGITVTGTAEGGASVVVGFGSASHTVTADSTGVWTCGFPASEVPTGTYEATVTATATDLAGNTASATATTQVDTEVNVTIETATIETDGVVNFDERSDGVTLTGTADAGTTVEVTLAGATRTVTTSTSGTWSADFDATDVPEGETTASASATATDAAGNSNTATGTVTIDTFVNELTLTSDLPGGDGVVNADERDAAISLTGTVEKGSTVVVSIAGVTATASVAADGSWTCGIPAGSLPEGEYTTELTITATDAAGNTRSMTEAVEVDTDAGYLTLSPDPIEGDDTVNAVEREDGVLVHGTATPGLTVTATLGDASQQTISAADGTWSTLFPKGSIPEGTYAAPITARTTDAAGNSLLVTDSVEIDTEIGLAFTGDPGEGDGIVSDAEASDGITIWGTADTGSTVVVSLEGASRTVTADATGAWEATYTAAEVPGGETSAQVVATATDPSGNVATITGQVAIDRIVDPLAMDRPVEGDNIVSAAEAKDGITLTGVVEEGSSVEVTFEGTTRAATVAADGSWSVDFTAAEVPAGDYDSAITIAATDAVGNTASLTEMVAIDTVAPDLPLITSIDKGLDGLRSVGVGGTDEGLLATVVASDGSTSNVAFDAEADPRYAETDLHFAAPVPDGSQLIISSTDEAGNQNAALFVLDESGTNTVSLSNPGFAGYNIGAIDLHFAENSELTISAADLKALSANDDSLTIHGGIDDQVTLTGATATGETKSIGGQSYDIYTLGDEGGTVIVDEDISVI